MAAIGKLAAEPRLASVTWYIGLHLPEPARAAESGTPGPAVIVPAAGRPRHRQRAHASRPPGLRRLLLPVARGRGPDGR
jgi:hypothetical protein